MKKSLFLLLFLFSLISCESDDNKNTKNATVQLTGKIVDELGNALSGVTINSGTNTVTSNLQGQFSIVSNTINDRGFISASKSSFFDTFKGFNGNSSAYVEIIMISKGNPTIFNSNTGAEISNNGGTVSISSNSLKTENGSDYTGEVTAYVRFFSPDNENFGLLMQGGDFRGISSTNQEGTLVSYGYFSVELEDENGNNLNLKNNTTAAITFEIASSQQNTAPTTMPLWYFDENIGIWKEEGFATKSGNQYMGNVSHFSSWNFDILFPLGIIKGKLVCTQNNLPYSYSLVILKEGDRRLYCYTNAQGEFQIEVPGNIMFELYLGSEENNVYWWGVSVTPNSVTDTGTLNYYCP